jgi:hypothetical protein
LNFINAPFNAGTLQSRKDSGKNPSCGIQKRKKQPKRSERFHYFFFWWLNPFQTPEDFIPKFPDSLPHRNSTALHAAGGTRPPGAFSVRGAPAPPEKKSVLGDHAPPF